MKAKAHTRGLQIPILGTSKLQIRWEGVIFMTAKSVYIRFVGTHAEYDKITDIKNI